MDFSYWFYVLGFGAAYDWDFGSPVAILDYAEWQNNN